MSEGPRRAGAEVRVARVVVVGAGVSGLVAASELADRLGPEAVTLLEASGGVGGLLRPVDVGGIRLDAGAESLLGRRPETGELLAAAGLDGERVAPEANAARILRAGALHAVPGRTLLGMPGDPAALAGLLDRAQVDVVAAERGRAHRPLEADDVSVDAFVRERLGEPVLRRLVEPLLGGVYAGRADRLGVRAVLPALWPAARDGTSVVDAVAALMPPRRRHEPDAVPVFAGVSGGVHRLTERLADRLRGRGMRLVTGAAVTGLRRAGTGWRVTTAEGEFDADGVLLAVPAPRAAALLAAVAPLAAAELAGVSTADVAVLAVRLPAGVLPSDAGTGVLVPPGELPVVKAVTFSSRKWGWLAANANANAGADGPHGPDGPDVVRLSVGRAGDDLLDRHDDDALVGLALDDLDRILAAQGRTPPVPMRRLLTDADVEVVRWTDALPQYDVGHLARMDRARAALDGVPAPLALAGSVVGGVGVPACVATARAAARDLVTRLPGAWPEW